MVEAPGAAALRDGPPLLRSWAMAKNVRERSHVRVRAPRLWLEYLGAPETEISSGTLALPVRAFISASSRMVSRDGTEG